VLFSGVGAVLVLSAVAPAVALGRTGLEIDVPRDATAGHPAPVTVSVKGAVGAAKLRVVAPPGLWVRLDGPGRGEVAVVPERRGLVGRVEIEVRSAAPFGLVWWRRPFAFPLPRPIEVGPAPVDVAVPAAVAAESSGEVQARAGTSADLLRSVREYVAGDPLRLVSWTATARHGQPMVKELEPAGQARLALVVDLRRDEGDAEVVAARAAGLACAALGAGMPVTLLTAEAAGPRAGPVSSRVEVSRRLARAVAGPLPPTPADAADLVVVAVQP
jgi:uncharacterized protein (DUF58 family)